MTKSSLFLAATITVLGTFTHQAHAGQFMNINFESDTFGTAPVTSVSANPDLHPQAIGGYLSDADPDPGESPPSPSSGTILIGPTGINNGAIFTTSPSTQANGQLWMDTNFNAHAQQVELSFDIGILSGLNNQTDQPKTLNTTGNTDLLFGINAFTSDTASGQQSFRFAAAPTSDTGGVFAMRSADNSNLVSFFNYAVGQMYHVEIDADYTTGRLDTYVNGSSTLSNFPFLTDGTLANATTQEFFMFLNGQLGDTNKVIIDNIDGSTTPEPASLGILGLGIAALITKRRRAQ